MIDQNKPSSSCDVGVDEHEVLTPEEDELTPEEQKERDELAAEEAKERGDQPDFDTWTEADDEAFNEAFDELAEKHPELIDPDYVPLPRGAATHSIVAWSKWAGEKLDVTELMFGTEDHAVVEHANKNILNARAKAFKTTFMLRLLCSAVTGKKLVPGFDVPLASAVLYLHAELGNSQIARRSRGAIKDLLPKYEQVLDRYYRESKDVNYSLLPNPDGIESPGQRLIREQVEAMVKKIGERRLTLVLDPLQNLIIGANENSMEEMSPCGHS